MRVGQQGDPHTYASAYCLAAHRVLNPQAQLRLMSAENEHAWFQSFFYIFIVSNSGAGVVYVCIPPIYPHFRPPLSCSNLEGNTTPSLPPHSEVGTSPPAPLSNICHPTRLRPTRERKHLDALVCSKPDTPTQLSEARRGGGLNVSFMHRRPSLAIDPPSARVRVYTTPSNLASALPFWSSITPLFCCSPPLFRRSPQLICSSAPRTKPPTLNYPRTRNSHCYSSHPCRSPAPTHTAPIPSTRGTSQLKSATAFRATDSRRQKKRA